jgi:hypothetical protein
VKVDAFVAAQPAIVLRFVGVEIVQYDMDFLARIVGDNVIYEAKEVRSPTPLKVAGFA